MTSGREWVTERMAKDENLRAWNRLLQTKYDSPVSGDEIGEEEKKERSVSESALYLVKRFRWPLALAFMAALIIAGTTKMMDRIERIELLDRLPVVGALSFNTEILKNKVALADEAARQILSQEKAGNAFGRKAGNLGELYQANHFYDQAAPCYQLATEFDRENPRWSYYLAFIQQEKGENESVQGLLETTISLAPHYAPAILKLADSYFKTGQIKDARIYYKRRLDLLPKDPYALLGLARISIDAAQWKTAQEYLEEAIRANPEFGPSHRLMASVHDHFDRRDDMWKSLQRAEQCIRFRPAPDPWVDALDALCYDVEQLLVLGSKAVIDLDIKKASGFFERAKDLDPKNPQVHLALGRLCFMVGQREEARGFFEKAIELDPRSDEAYFQLGVISRRQGNLREAEKMFHRSLDFHPDNPNVYNNLGVTLLEQQKFREAVKALNKALEIYPEHINARYNLGLALWSLGKTASAVQEYRNVLSVKPDWATAANSLAWVLATDKNDEIRNGDEAIRWASVACQGEGRKNPEYLDTLAAAYAEAGRFQEAIRTVRESLTIARSSGDSDLAEELEKKLHFYESGKVFTE